MITLYLCLSNRENFWQNKSCYKLERMWPCPFKVYDAKERKEQSYIFPGFWESRFQYIQKHGQHDFVA